MWCLLLQDLYLYIFNRHTSDETTHSIFSVAEDRAKILSLFAAQYSDLSCLWI